MERLLHESIPGGTKVHIHIIDDDSDSNTFWNNVFKQEVDLSLSGDLSCTQFARVTAKGEGVVQLIKNDQFFYLDSGDYIATASFITPHDEVWAVSGPIMDEKKRHIGNIDFGQIWSSGKQHLVNTKEEASDARSNFVFWGVLGLVAIAIFTKFIFSRQGG